MLPNKTLILIGAGVAAVVLLVSWYGSRRLASAINPLDRENVFYSGVNAVGAQLSGDAEFSLGGWLADVFNPAAREVARQYGTGTTAP